MAARENKSRGEMTSPLKGEQGGEKQLLTSSLVPNSLPAEEVTSEQRQGAGPSETPSVTQGLQEETSVPGGPAPLGRG